MNWTEAMVEKLCRRAAELVAQGWCQGVQARDGFGIGCNALEEKAQSWCLTGALSRACYETAGIAVLSLEEQDSSLAASLGRRAGAAKIVCAVRGLRTGPDWNNAPERTQGEVERFLLAMAEA